MIADGLSSARAPEHGWVHSGEQRPDRGLMRLAVTDPDKATGVRIINPWDDGT
ncbi:hypothetical protein BD293_3587 [Roseinatronobacter monicus]|uniref:Uncharacterized protein n=1 Tax=Roseinatronobacter monicus TaxID=393481 RepID=A0A543KII8_9RHOB|nr:hypothetical protein BD293_3587 [Roseinatronobacter monicus]